MTPHSVLNSITKLAPSKTLENNKKIKKRHWFLASVIIFGGSWITHTTTANISEQSVEQKTNTGTANSAVTNITPFTFLTTDKNTPSLALLNQQFHTPGVDSNILLLPQATKTEVENFTTETYKIKKGDSLGSIFRKLKLDQSLPYKISQHQTAKKLVSITTGKELTFSFNDQSELRGIHYPTNTLQNFVIEFESGAITEAKTIDISYQTEQRTTSGEIQSSLYEAAQKAGVSDNIIMEMVRIFGWDVDFVLDIRSGDHFHVIYERYMLGDKHLTDGNILAAEFSTQGRTYRAIRYEAPNGSVSYYTPEGKSMLGTFLRSPVEFSRISSRFGKRKHPILKTWRAHNGVDYAAQRGTPILATADGRIIHKGTKGGYGRTVVISHAGRFSTLYAHMNAYAKNIKSGSHVKQGQIIGYVGSSGLATGPHLHYEFRVNGAHRNPLTYKTPKANSIGEKSKADFLLVANAMQIELDKVTRDYQIAKATKQTIQR